MKTLGVLGGMGPLASIEFYTSIIKESERRGVSKNHEFPHLLISNLPVPDFISDRTREEESIQMVEEEAIRLELSGADELVIICNTMHLHLSRFQEAVSIPFISMIEVVTEYAKNRSQTIGILGSPTTISSKLYQKPLEAAGRKVLVPTAIEQEEITQAIYRTIAGVQDQSDVEKVAFVISRLKDHGAESVILGCTELPVLLRGYKASIPLFSSIDLLVSHICDSDGYFTKKASFIPLK